MSWVSRRVSLLLPAGVTSSNVPTCPDQCQRQRIIVLRTCVTVTGHGDEEQMSNKETSKEPSNQMLHATVHTRTLSLSLFHHSIFPVPRNGIFLPLYPNPSSHGHSSLRRSSNFSTASTFWNVSPMSSNPFSKQCLRNGSVVNGIAAFPLSPHFLLLEINFKLQSCLGIL